MLLTENVPNLIGGVSQQAEALRYPSQCVEQENFYPTVLRGLSKRPPTTHVRTMATGDVLGGNYTVKKIEPVVGLNYFLFLGDGALKVYDLAGTEQTVVAPSGYGYLDCDDPTKQLRTLTVKDYTFIVNTSKVVQAAAKSPSTARTPEALLMVKQVRDGANYKIKLFDSPTNGTPDHTVDVVDVKLGSSSTFTGPLVADQGDVVTNLGVGLDAGPIVALYEHYNEGELLYIRKRDGSDFRVEVECSVADGFYVYKEQAQNLAMLPRRGWANFLIKVAGDPETSGDDYYLRYVPQTEGVVGFAEGSWQEAQAPGLTDDVLVASTMPHALINHGSYFTFEPLTWLERTAGDSESNPVPSFVGNTINQVFFRKNRLGFLSKGNLVLSCAGDFFNFWRTTVVQLLDGDVIDVAGAHAKDGDLINAAQTSEKLVLFSEQSQLVAEEADILAPKTVGLTPTSEFPSITAVQPEVVGDSVFFPFKKGAYTGFIEYMVRPQTGLFGGDEITEHVPRYITGDLNLLAASPTLNILAGRADDPSLLYVYTFFKKATERVQSSWFKFRFNGSIRGYGFFGSRLYLVLLRNSELCLEWMDLSAGLQDNKPDGSSVFVTSLDRRVDETQVTCSYSTATALTTITLPYTATSALRVIRRSNTGYGSPLAIYETYANVVVVNGDVSASQLWIGEVYTSTMTLTRPTLRMTKGGGEQAVSPGRFQVRNGTITADDTLDFRVEVTPLARGPFTYLWSQRVLGTNTAVAGSEMPPRSLPFRFPVNSRNDQVTVKIINDSHLPCNLLSLDWEALYANRARGV